MACHAHRNSGEVDFFLKIGMLVSEKEVYGASNFENEFLLSFNRLLFSVLHGMWGWCIYTTL